LTRYDADLLHVQLPGNKCTCFDPLLPLLSLLAYRLLCIEFLYYELLVTLEVSVRHSETLYLRSSWLPASDTIAERFPAVVLNDLIKI
jgi:hypothetical protein